MTPISQHEQALLKLFDSITRKLNDALDVAPELAHYISNVQLKIDLESNRVRNGDKSPF